MYICIFFSLSCRWALSLRNSLRPLEIILGGAARRGNRVADALWNHAHRPRGLAPASCLRLIWASVGVGESQYAMLLHTAAHCNTLQHTATHCNTLQHTATHCNTLHLTAICNGIGASILPVPCSSKCWSGWVAMHHDVAHCSTLQHTITHCITMQHAIALAPVFCLWRVWASGGVVSCSTPHFRIL